MQILRQQVTVRTLAVFSLLLLCLTSCRRPPYNAPATPVTITFIGWSTATLRELSEYQGLLDQFMQQTGIRVNLIPGPESIADRLALYRQFLGEKSSTPDVYLSDVAWPGVLADEMLDLKPFFQDETSHYFPVSIQSDTVNGRLVGMPFQMQFGVLYYRADLLRKYGYKKPPTTWDELEPMAARIQAGERAAGHREFWGYVWPGALFEGLTCNALERQMSNGGGDIVESNGTISVNNPQAVQALQRTRHWLGVITPFAVVAFKDKDVRNFWDEGNVAFARGWVWREYTHGLHPSATGSETAMALIPGGSAGQVSMLGGQFLSISKYSAHPAEAAAFVRFLVSHATEQELWNMNATPPSRLEFYDDPASLKSRPEIERTLESIRSAVIQRPVAVTGTKYEEVSVEYSEAVHSVLTGQVQPDVAMAQLEKKLISITGLKTGPPLPRQGIH